MNPFRKRTGSYKLNNPVFFLTLVVSMVFASYMIANGGILIGVMLILIPFLIFFLTQVFDVPRFGFMSVLSFAFLAIGLTRYITSIPLGLGIDLLLVLTYLSVFFKGFDTQGYWKPVRNDLAALALVWYLYALFQLVNPEAVSRVAWFYAMRGVALYMFLSIPLVFMVFNKNKDLNTFLYIWGSLSMLATIKGAMQLYLGVDYAEQRWLDNGAAQTHVLFGKLRVFSIYSDAGQFGAAQAHAGLVGSILFINLKKRGQKFFFGAMALSGFYGMFISGTRGAMAVPVAGLFLYLILTKNMKALTAGAIVGILIFAFFKFTTIGNSNYHINRMRTAFDPNDASLQVRLANQRVLKEYLKSRPFGGGIGSAGNWGQRFTPNTFLANVPTDSWYVMIWAEQGIVGLMLHLGILFFIVIKGSYIIMYRIKDPELKAKLMGLAPGIAGIMGASYGNGVLGQLPTGIIIYTSMAFIYLGPKIDKEIRQDNSGFHDLGL